MATPSPGRQIAVVPYTDQTFRVTNRLAQRCAETGIELALVSPLTLNSVAAFADMRNATNDFAPVSPTGFKDF